MTLSVHQQIHDHDSTLDYSDDDSVARGRGEPETKPILSVRKWSIMVSFGPKRRQSFEQLMFLKILGHVQLKVTRK